MSKDEFVYVTERDEYCLFVDHLESFEELAGDSETYTLPQYRHLKGASALDPHTGRISVLTLQGRDDVPIVFDILLLERNGYNPQLMHDLLVSRKKLIFHNAQFDGKFLKRHYGIVPSNLWCTRLMAKLITNATGSKYGKLCGHTLADLCRDYLGINLVGKGAEQTTDWYARPDFTNRESEGYKYWVFDKLKYAANDVKYLFDLHDLFLKVIYDPLPYSPILADGVEGSHGLGMSATLPLEMKMAVVAAEMEYNGLPASREIFDQIQKSIQDPSTGEGALTTVASKLCVKFGLDTEPSFWGDTKLPTQRSYKALNNPQILKELINKQVGLELDNSQTQVLERFIDLTEEIAKEGATEFVDQDEEELYRQILDYSECEAVQASELAKLVIEYKQLRKLYSMDLRSHINPLTGCIHSRLDVLGAATGRSSSSGPNLQNVSARTYVEIEREREKLFPSSANYESLIPDWVPPCKA